jgi:carbonic anhydrase/acetyltransferase-like protein (isoleucine patch superfamily)
MIRALNGKTPQIDPTAYISEAAYVVGDVVMGPHSSVWPGAVIRADHGRITIGSHTNIQDNSVVHSDAGASLGNYVTLGHGVVCHAARVGDHTLLGNGCVVNDGAVIANHCIVASGAVVLAGKQVAEGSLTAGLPAEIKGRLLKRHHLLIEHISSSYVKLAQLYKAEGLE